MKIVFIVFDGLADRPIKELGNKTPLEVANKPNLDELAKRGVNGLLDIISPGKRIGSDVAHLSILGYDPYKYYTGRGPLEASGIGLELDSNDVAFRANFATVSEDFTVIDRRAGRIKEGTKELEKAINEIDIGVDFIFKASVAHRGALVLKGKGLSDKVSDTDPHEVGVKVMEAKPLENTKEAKRTAEIINEFTKKVHEVLNNHRVNVERAKRGLPKANIVLLRGAGRTPKLEPFEKRYGIKGACIAKTAIIKGIARLLGMEVIDSKEDFLERGKQIFEALNRNDFVLLNIKEPDEAGHDGNYEKKIKIIEEADKMIGMFLDYVEENYLVVLSDHTTPVSFRDHTGDEVPVLIAGPEVRSDDVTTFSERSVYKGYLNRIRALDLMTYMLNLTNRLEKYGA